MTGSGDTAGDRERVQITSQAELRRWLGRYHAQETSVWLVTFKKHCGDRYISNDQVLDELVAFGWTDGRKMKVDNDRTMQLISPRRTDVWAASYKERAARLIAEGRIHSAGLASIERAKQSGGWNAAQSVDAIEIPDDLRAALRRIRGATAGFRAFPPSARRNILRWIASAKKPDTRRRRVVETARTAAIGERPIA